MRSLCPICGWGDSAHPLGRICRTVDEAVLCKVNWHNRLRYENRYKGEIQRGELDTPVLVRSVGRYQGKEGKGDSNEQFEPVSIEEARQLLQESVI